MPAKKQSRSNKKSSSQVTKPMANVTTTEEEDDGFGSIAILMRTGPSSRSSTQSNKSKKSVEKEEVKVVETVPEWEQLGMTKEAFEELRAKTAKEMAEAQVENLRQSYLADIDSVSYWQGRKEFLEKLREPYNKMPGWSADVIGQVEQLDLDIKECEDEIDRLQQEAYEQSQECGCGSGCEECDPDNWEKCSGCGGWEPAGSMDHCSGYGYYCTRACGPAGYASDYRRW